MGSVIQATWTVEFEDVLRMGDLSGGCWCPCGGCFYFWITFKQLPAKVWYGCHKDPILDKIPKLLDSVHNCSGF